MIRSRVRQRAGGHAVRHRRMSRRQRFWIYSIVGVLWLSGTLWLLLDQFCAKRGEFGVTPHPLEAPLLLLHGVLAIVSMYLFGWLVARHVSRWWPARQRRLSGGVLTGFLTLLSVSGFALFFLVDDASLHIAALTHDVLGLTAAIFGIQHWFFHGSQGVETTT
jgi:uncharacterized membrane protein